MKQMAFTVACKDYFGYKPGQTMIEFMKAEELTAKTRDLKRSSSGLLRDNQLMDSPRQDRTQLARAAAVSRVWQNRRAGYTELQNLMVATTQK
jgi:hypothetical protein